MFRSCGSSRRQSRRDGHTVTVMRLGWLGTGPGGDDGDRARSARELHPLAQRPDRAACSALHLQREPLLDSPRSERPKYRSATCPLRTSRERAERPGLGFRIALQSEPDPKVENEADAQVPNLLTISECQLVLYLAPWPDPRTLQPARNRVGPGESRLIHRLQHDYWMTDRVPICGRRVTVVVSLQARPGLKEGSNGGRPTHRGCAPSRH